MWFEMWAAKPITYSSSLDLSLKLQTCVYSWPLWISYRPLRLSPPQTDHICPASFFSSCAPHLGEWCCDFPTHLSLQPWLPILTHALPLISQNPTLLHSHFCPSPHFPNRSSVVCCLNSRSSLPVSLLSLLKCPKLARLLDLTSCSPSATLFLFLFLVLLLLPTPSDFLSIGYFLQVRFSFLPLLFFSSPSWVRCSGYVITNPCSFFLSFSGIACFQSLAKL